MKQLLFTLFFGLSITSRAQPVEDMSLISPMHFGSWVLTSESVEKKINFKLNANILGITSSVDIAEKLGLRNVDMIEFSLHQQDCKVSVSNSSIFSCSNSQPLHTDPINVRLTGVTNGGLSKVFHLKSTFSSMSVYSNTIETPISVRTFLEARVHLDLKYLDGSSLSNLNLSLSELVKQN